MDSIRRIGRSIAYNIYAVAVIYVRFAALCLGIYLVAYWFFAEYEMVHKDQGASAAADALTSTTPSPSVVVVVNPSSTPLHIGGGGGGEL